MRNDIRQAVTVYTYFTFNDHVNIFILYRIWGSFGQKLLEETKIIILSIDNEPNSFLTRTLALLKLSGIRNIQIFKDIPDVMDKDTLFIIDLDLYSKFRQDLISYSKIVYKNLSFKSVFPNRLCKC
jgi:hypothetical protein